MKRCMFDNGLQGCGVLDVRRCKGCKFRKSEKEFNKAQKEAERSLTRRGLRAVRKDTDRGAVITVEKIGDG